MFISVWRRNDTAFSTPNSSREWIIVEIEPTRAINANDRPTITG